MKSPKAAGKKSAAPATAEPTPVAAAPAAAKKSPTLPETTEGYPWVSNHEIKKESNPFTDRDWRMWTYAWFGLLVRVLLVFGGMFSVYQFLMAREEKRVERSLALVEMWEEPGYQTAQEAVRQRLAALNTKFPNPFGEKPTVAERSEYLERLGLIAVSADGGDMPLQEFQAHFDRIVYFLNRMSFCIEGDLCSRDVADAFFRDYAVSFWAYFSGYVAKQRKAGASTYAMPIENYVLRDVEPAAQ